MQSVFIRLLKVYKRHGFLVRTGLNPYYFAEADAPFARLCDASGQPVGVGAGLAPQEIQFLELLLGTVKPSNVLVIGNAFGWSAIAAAMSAPDANVVAMEAGLEGDATARGTVLTHAIAAEEHLRVKVVTALSPRDTAGVVAREFGGQLLDFVLIDGLHANEQLLRDIDGVLPHAAPGCIFFLHDVLSWHMVGAFDSAVFGSERERRILTRCPSGPGLVFPSTLGVDAREIVEAFVDDTTDVAAMHAELGASADRPGARLERRLADGWALRRLGLAGTWAAEGKTEMECEELQRAADEAPDDASVQYEVGVRHADRARWSDAERTLRRALTLAPDWALPLQQLGRVLRERGELAEARERLEQAAASEPAWAAPCFELGLVARALGETVDAYHWFRKAADLAPEWALASLECGRAAIESGEHAAAMRVLRPVLDAGVVTHGVPHLLALATERHSGLAAATPIFLLAAAVSPGVAEVQFDAARMLAARGDEAAALDHFVLAGGLRPEWDAPWSEAFALACRLGRVADAVLAANHLGMLGIASPETWLAVANMEAGAGGGEAARQAALRVLHLRSEPTDPLKVLGMRLMEKGDVTSAERLFADLVGRFPEWAGVHFERGRALETLGRADEASVAYERAATLRPQWSGPKDALARLRSIAPVRKAS